MCAARERGLTLVELVVFIAVVGVAVAGVLKVLDYTVRSSADPLVQKQALAIAESLMEEIQLQPFTWCDPDDANAATATSAAGCAATPEAMGAEAGETRYSAATPFDNVNDYDGFAMAGIRDILNTPIAALAGYNATVAVAAAALGDIAAASGDALLITVTVTGPANTSVQLQGYRSRYAPKAVP